MNFAPTKKSLAVFACGAALTLAACSQQEVPSGDVAPPDAAMTAMATLERQLDIVAPPGYIERGESDSAFDWVSAFEAASGCSVNVSTAATADELDVLLASNTPHPSPPADASRPPPGGAPFDLVVTTGDVSIRLIRAGAVQPIDSARVPSYASIEPRFRQAPWHFVDGRHYGVPYQWSPNVLIYDTDIFETPPGSWSVVFEAQQLPDGKPNKGRIQAPGRPIYIADAALYLMTRRPELGITDPYELDESQYGAALELLRRQRALLHGYWQDPVSHVRDLQYEGVVAASSSAIHANTLLANKAPVAMLVPVEGATGVALTTMLVNGARHPNCAYRWMEWSLTPRVQGDVAAYAGSHPVVPAACEGNELLGADGCRHNGGEHLDRVRFWRAPEAACASHAGGCVPYSRWIADYSALILGK